MKIAVIGSLALRMNGVNVERNSIDTDIIASYDDMMEYAKTFFKTIVQSYPINEGKKWVIKGIDTNDRKRILEAELAWDGSLAAELLELILNDPQSVVVGEKTFASLDVLYMLKMSHRYLKNSPHFTKTMNDIHTLRKCGAKIRNEHVDFYNRRVEATYSYGHPKLNQSKNDFFADDGINYVYDHDSIHEQVKQMENPAYSYFKHENEEVLCDMKKFFEIDEQIRLNAVFEESMVLALERSIVPYNLRSPADYGRSFKMALQKVCTSITSGKFREYAWENYNHVLGMFNPKIFDKFFENVDKGLVKPYS